MAIDNVLLTPMERIAAAVEVLSGEGSGSGTSGDSGIVLVTLAASGSAPNVSYTITSHTAKQLYDAVHSGETPRSIMCVLPTDTTYDDGTTTWHVVSNIYSMCEEFTRMASENAVQYSITIRVGNSTIELTATSDDEYLTNNGQQ